MDYMESLEAVYQPLEELVAIAKPSQPEIEFRNHVGETATEVVF